MGRREGWRLTSTLLAFAILLALAPGTRGQPSQTTHHVGDCVVCHEVPGPLVLPDGTVRDVAELALCLKDWYTPSRGLLEVVLDGEPWGMVMTTAGHVGGAEASVMAFRRWQNSTGWISQPVTLDALFIPERNGLLGHVVQPWGSRAVIDVDQQLAGALQDGSRILVAAELRR